MWAVLFTWIIWRLPAIDGPWIMISLRVSGLLRSLVVVASISPLVIIFVTVFIDLLGFGIIIPLLPFYAESFGASAFTIGLLGTSFSLMQFLFSPVWGRWSDRIGRKPIILVGLMGSCLSYLGLALSTSLALLFVSRIVGGIAGANIPTAQAYIADVTTPENRARGMGMVGAAFGLGFIFGPAIGGVLSRISPETPMWFASALCFANFVAAWFLLPESRSADASTRSLGRMEAFRHAFTKPTLLLLLALYFIVTLAFSGFEATFAIFSEARFGYTASTIGFVFAFIGVILAIVQGVLVGKVVKVVSERRLIPLAILAIALGIGLIPFVWNVPTLLGALFVLAVGMGFNNPSLSSMVSRLADPNDQGGILGLASSLASLGRVVGPAAGGYLYDAYGMTTPYMTCGGVDDGGLCGVFRRSSICGGAANEGDASAGERRRMNPKFLHAANPGPMTGEGNWTYLIGDRNPVLIDAGVGQRLAPRCDCGCRASRSFARARHARAQRSRVRRSGDSRAMARRARSRSTRGRYAIRTWAGSRWPTERSWRPTRVHFLCCTRRVTRPIT